jgi:hypothetical protein
MVMDWSYKTTHLIPLGVLHILRMGSLFMVNLFKHHDFLQEFMLITTLVHD